MVNSTTEWLAKLKESYPRGLEDFDDAQTVRFMRRQEVDFIAEHARISATIEDPAGRADYDEIFADDIAEAKGNVELLDKWLHERGFKP